MVEPNFRGGDVALFIDWENFKISLAAGNRSPNLSSLKEEVSNQGRVVVAKAYADWVTRAPELRGASQFINDPPSLYAAGIEPVFVPTRMPSTQASTANGMRTYRVKNSVDVKMTADCIECAHSYPNIGTFVLVSGDSDFLHVVNALRTMGKQVVVIGVSWSTSRRMADQVDSLLLYDKDVDPLAPQPAVLPQHAARAVTQPTASPDAPAPAADAPLELADVIRAIEEIIREERAAGGQPLLTSIKQRMMRRYPSFDEKKLGFSGFKKLMARAAEDGNIKLIHSGLVDWAIMSDEDTPEGTTEDAPLGAPPRPGRRRGGRRRQGSQRDLDAADTGDDDTSDDEVADAIGAEPGAEEDVDLADLVPVFSGAMEETAATDFDAPVEEEPERNAAIVEETERSAAWFDIEEDVEEEAGTEEEFTAVPSETAPEPVSISPVFEPEATVEAEAESEPEDVFGNDAELAAAVRETIASLSMPADPEDGQNPERVSDLLVMADHLEHRQGVSHVSFNFLVAEVCAALEQGLAAGNEQIAQRWSNASSKDYVGRMLRGLSQGDFFRRSNYTWREESTRRRRQRATFNLVRDNELVAGMLTARLGPAADSQPPIDPPGEQAMPPAAEAPPQEETGQDETRQEEIGQHDFANGVQADPAGAEDAPASVDEPQDGVANGVAELAEATEEADSADAQEPADQPEDAADAEPTATLGDDAESETVGAAPGDDELYDEPQPRSTRRRRPFSSRLLRS